MSQSASTRRLYECKERGLPAQLKFLGGPFEDIFYSVITEESTVHVMSNRAQRSGS